MLDWQSTSVDFDNAPAHDILYIFELAQASGRTRRVSETILVKKCLTREYQNQVFAWETLNGTILRVPRPIRYIAGSSEGENGFMVMEFLHGCPWDEVGEDEEPCTTKKVHEAIRRMHSTTPNTTELQILPGPLDGGYADSFPWGRGQKQAEDTFKSLHDVMECANKRLVRYAKRNKHHHIRRMDFEHQRLAICHGDLAPRNILILSNGQVALLDWEWMCMYPSIFELACLSMLEMDHPHEKQKSLIDLLKADACVGRTREDVEEDMKTLRIVDRVSLQFSF